MTLGYFDNTPRTTKRDTANRKAAFLAAIPQGQSLIGTCRLTQIPETTVAAWRKTDHAFSVAFNATFTQAQRLARRPPERERKMLRMIAQGYSNRQIATELHLSMSAVCGHITEIMRKHHAVNRAMLAVAAVRVGAIVVEVQL